MDISGLFLCSRCMRQIEEEEICPYCGYNHREAENKSPALCRGTMLNGRYQLGSVIGFGGFGITYAAYDELLETPVAVKEYFPVNLANRDTEESDDVCIPEGSRAFFKAGMAHFIREARVLSMLKDLPGVVTVQDYFEENETAYIVMEFIRGMTLEQWAQENPVKPEKLFSMLRDPIAALKALHEQGILHRDIKPSNLMVQENGRVKLIDFGSAGRMDHAGTLIIMTVEYAPPELYAPGGQPQGAWTDIYSLCVTIYELLTGETPPAASVRAQKDTLIPLKKKKLHLKKYQERAVMAGLEMDVRRRPQSVAEFWLALYNEPTPEQLRLRKKYLSGTVAAVALAVLAGVCIGKMDFNFAPEPSGVLMNADETDFSEYRVLSDSGGDAAVFGNGDYHRDQIASVTFLDSLDAAGEDAWDVSAAQNKSVLAWAEADESGNLYDLYLAADGGVKANEDCKYAFAFFENAEEISFGGNFDTSGVTRMDYMFHGCDNLIQLDTEQLSTVRVTSMKRLFSGCGSLKNVNLQSWDTSKTESMEGMFAGCYSISELDLSMLDTACVRDMDSVFLDCRSLESLDIRGLDTAQVRDMSNMFSGCICIRELDLGEFNTSKVTDMNSMFYDCSSLVTLDIGSFDVSSVEDADFMFYNCSSLLNLDLSMFDGASCSVVWMLTGTLWEGEEPSEVRLEAGTLMTVTDSDFLDFNWLEDSAEDVPVFGNADVRRSEIASITVLDSLDGSGGNAWDVSAAGDQSVLAWTEKNGDLYDLYLAADGGVKVNREATATFGCFDHVEEIHLNGNLDTSQAVAMESMFRGCSRLTELDLSGIDTENVQSMWCMFDGCESLEALDLSGFDTGNVTDMEAVFRNCKSLQKLDVSGFDTGKVAVMSELFEECRNLRTLDVSGFDTSEVTTMDRMFNGCQSLEELDVSGFHTENVMSAGGMFQNCRSLKTLDVSGFSTDCCYMLDGMFNGCVNLETLDVSGFSTGWVTGMQGMFANCQSLQELDVSGFDTSDVTDMSYMFYDCRKLESLDLSGFDTSNVTDMSYMFYNCRNLENLDLSGFRMEEVETRTGMFAGTVFEGQEDNLNL